MASARARIQQLKEWLEWRKTTTGKPGEKTKKKFSKNDHYKKVNKRYGGKNNN
tara:strand:- start:275 stop:433 length:159 start_codon:yes stop_codon:yes gene_type:complete